RQPQPAQGNCRHCRGACGIGLGQRGTITVAPRMAQNNEYVHVVCMSGMQSGRHCSPREAITQGRLYSMLCVWPPWTRELCQVLHAYRRLPKAGQGRTVLELELRVRRSRKESEIRGFFSRFVSDRLYLKIRHLRRLKQWPDTRNAATFNEKLLNYKLQNKANPLFTRLADKIAAKDYVRGKVGDQYVTPLLWSGIDGALIPF